MIKNILFDLDGVLFDGTQLHKTLFLNSLNTIIPDNPLSNEYHDLYLNGLSTNQKLKYLVSKGIIEESYIQDIATKKQEMTEKTIQELNVEYAERIRNVLNHFASYKLFCVTNCIQKTCELVLDSINIKEFFTGFIVPEVKKLEEKLDNLYDKLIDYLGSNK
jgi:beta-phosphoglucomutase-like phosphatase (HAD superfamily)